MIRLSPTVHFSQTLFKHRDEFLIRSKTEKPPNQAARGERLRFAASGRSPTTVLSKSVGRAFAQS